MTVLDQGYLTNDNECYVFLATLHCKIRHTTTRHALRAIDSWAHSHIIMYSWARRTLDKYKLQFLQMKII